MHAVGNYQETINFFRDRVYTRRDTHIIAQNLHRAPNYYGIIDQWYMDMRDTRILRNRDDPYNVDRRF